MIKRRLLAPGPVEVPPQVLEAMSRPVFLHRGERFRDLLGSVRERLARLACVPGDDVVVVTGSGTAAFEAALLASVPAGSKVLALEAGKFGERWAAMARRFGYDTRSLAFEWGRSVEPQAVARLLQEEPGVAAVLTTHSETSTGALHDVRAVAEAVRESAPDALVLVDAVTSLGAAELRPRDWGLDGVVSGSQKGVMVPPGLGFVWLSERAWNRAGGRQPPSYYLDLHKERAAQARGETAYTPALSLLAGLDVALEMLLEEGLEPLWSRRASLNAALLDGGRELGFIPYAERPSPAVAAMTVPGGVSARDVVVGLERRGISISGGQDRAADVLVRPSLLGWADRYDALTVVAALEETLREMGREVPHGSGLAATMKALESR